MSMIGINWTIVAVSLSVATVIFYFYLWVVALVRKQKAEKQVKLSQAKLQRFYDALKERQKNLRGK